MQILNNFSEPLQIEFDFGETKFLQHQNQIGKKIVHICKRIDENVISILTIVLHDTDTSILVKKMKCTDTNFTRETAYEFIGKELFFWIDFKIISNDLFYDFWYGATELKPFDYKTIILNKINNFL